MQGKRIRWRRANRYFSASSVELIQSGSDYFDRLVSLINSARYEIHLQAYIFSPDETGRRVIDALLDAARRGVQILILIDAYGSQDFSSALIRQFRAEGIFIRKYGVLYTHGRFHLGRRMHRKVVVVDGHTSLVGGMNISNHYNDVNGPPWLDFAAQCEGEVSRKLQSICRQLWLNVPFRPFSRKIHRQIFPLKTTSGKAYVRISRNDFFRNRHEIAIGYRQAIRKAKHSLLIVGGYFLPGGATRRLIRTAVDRGVNIRVVVSERSDVGIFIYARRYLYRWLFRHKVRVFEYKVSNVHGKVLVADNRWTSIGSYDLNNLSTYTNIELNMEINDAGFATGFTECMEKIIANDCREIDAKNFYPRLSLFSKFVMWIAYYSVKTLFGLSVVLAGKKDRL